MKKRTLLIAGLLLAAAVVSCGEAAGSEPKPDDPETGAGSASGEESVSAPESDAEPQTEEPDWKNAVVYTVYPEPDIPADLDLTGKTFRISERGGDTLFSEELTGEIINDAVFNRNLQVEDHFGIKIEVEHAEPMDGNLKTIVASGLPDFDMVYGCGDNMTSLISLGYALDLCSVPYIDFNDGFWYPDLLGQFSCYGRVFLTPSDITPSILGIAEVTFFNKRLVSEYDLESPYQMVYDNTWTLDNFLTMIRQVTADLNGDGVMDEHDLCGIGTFDGEVVGTFIALVFGSGMRITAPNADGSLSFAMEAEKLQSIIDRATPVLKDPSLAFSNSVYGPKVNPDGSTVTMLFEEGHYLFELNFLYEMQRDLRNMEDDFGVAPIPKYDETQENYHHRANPLSHFYCVPSTSADLEKTGAVFTYMSWLSSQTVLPAYFEVTLKQKRTRDEDSAYMLDLIRRTLYFDFGDLWTKTRNYIAYAFDSGSYERSVGATLKKLTKDLDKLQSKLKNLD